VAMTRPKLAGRLAVTMAAPKVAGHKLAVSMASPKIKI
jgi:hypothetical protein